MSQHKLTRAGSSNFRDSGQDGLIHRAFLRGEGYTHAEVRRWPIIGICSSWSELNPCNAGLRELAELVKRGVESAGGLALEFPTISISEPFTRPSSLYLRNLMSMDVEEMISSSPIDGVVLLAGCDKTVPAALMGAVSANKPTIMVTAGPRPVPCHDGVPMTIDDLWPACEARRLGQMSDAEWEALEGDVNTGVGTCNVMGTATTMAAIAEMLGFALPGSALASAASEKRGKIAHKTGAQIVETVKANRLPKTLLTMAALENAFRVSCALGGSTNAMIHLEAIGGRNSIRIGSRTFARWADDTPWVADVKPGGRYLLSDLENAGGVPAVAKRISDVLNLSTLAADGSRWSDVAGKLDESSHVCIAPMNGALSQRGSICVLHGTLASRGAVLKTAGTSEPRLLQHRGRAMVFDGLDDLHARIDDPDLDVDENSILVLRGLGVLGAPGMPEVGHIPIPARLAREGVRDMLRISDARMSGTATGTIVLHVTPEAAVGGALALLQSGDEIELDYTGRTLNHFLADEELLRRSEAAAAAPATPAATASTAATARRGYQWLHHQHALQPDFGCDFDFLRGDFAGILP